MIIEKENLTEKEAFELLAELKKERELIEEFRKQLKSEREQVEKERSLMREERIKLDRDKIEFTSQSDVMTKILTQKEMQFEMKWKLLEEETCRLAEDKKRFEARQRFFDRVKAYEEDAHANNVVNGEMFFQGVATGQALKKRYRDLIKIYHPDNDAGDKQTIQEINREYANLQKSLAE